MKLADKWVWEEYPDQVLIHEENVTKWPRYLSAALNTPEWLDVAFANRFRREGFDYPFNADQEGTTWDWGQRTRFRTTAKWKQFRAEFELQGANSGEDSETDVVGSSTFNAANVQQLFVSMTLPNVLNSGLRTDLHFGRINLDIGSRRIVARSRFSNTSQAFDGIHWRLAKSKEWFFRAFFTKLCSMTITLIAWPCLPIRKIDSGACRLKTANFLGLRAQLYYYGTDSESRGNRPSRTHSTIGLRVSMTPLKVDSSILIRNQLSSLGNLMEEIIWPISIIFLSDTRFPFSGHPEF